MSTLAYLAYDATPSPATLVLPLVSSDSSGAYPPVFGTVQTITLPHIASTATAVPPFTDALRVGGGILTAIKSAGLAIPGVG